MHSFETVSICGLHIHNVNMEEAVEVCLSLAGRPAAVYTPNAEISKAAMEDPAFMALLNEGDLVIPDGAGVVLASKQLGSPLKGKVAGAELAQQLLAPMAERGLRLFLFGGKPGVAERAAERVQKDHPNLIVCGTADGYFSDE
ncbi:MAG: WecB/TagA/CpsF family glycosyltransferase, partial [Clostridia bacterium]|nr:WecB/TagA/CpsF family glycosyltransferase [Clostridia bacterium]